ncbi:MAG: RluA family pseudouridine synthase [Planctomycetota bacterium]|jgi:23S rRNA pseudouridine1911/1915/1917 synthase
MSRVPPDLSKEKEEAVFTVRGDEAGLRLDVFLKARVPWRSREHLKERIRDEEVLVNGRGAKASAAVRAGDEVRVTLARRGVPFDPATIPLPILYEDEVIVVLDKPAGYVVHPVGRHQMDTIINALHHRYRRPDDPARDVVPKLAHRLDRFTSGVLLVAKRDDIRSELGRQFADREVSKEYLAIVMGRPDPERGEVEAPIGKNPHSPNGLPMMVKDDGEPSLTLYETERDLGEWTLVRFRPMSGRTHQIRVHAQWLGTPLVADAMYGDGEPLVADGEVLLDRYPLHSARLEFRHPVRDERMSIEATLPEDMRRAIEALSR